MTEQASDNKNTNGGKNIDSSKNSSAKAPGAYSVTVVVPAYNAQQYIVRTLDSVLAQTYRPLEVVVVDDGSVDETAEVVRKYIEKQRTSENMNIANGTDINSVEIRYILRENGGAAAARNTGIKAAQGNWVAFIDADDEWLPEKLQRQMAIAKKNPDLMWVMCNYYFHLVSNDDRWLPMKPDVFDNLLAGRDYLESYFAGLNHNLKWNPVAMVVRRDVFDEVGLFKEGMHLIEDIDMWLRIAYKWPRIGFANEPLAVWYCGNEGSFTRDMELENKFKWDCMLYERHMQLSSQTIYHDNVKEFLVHKMCHFCIGLYSGGRFDLISNIVKKYHDTLPLRCRILMYFFSLKIVPHGRMVQKLLCCLMGHLR